MKTLLLDIDYTLFEGDVPRPHLKEFLETMDSKYRIHFYTAGTHYRVAEACRVLIHKLGMDRDFVRNLQRTALTRENCKMISLPNGAEVKCLKKAGDILEVAVEDIILLDDNPSYDNPHVKQVIQAEGFMADMENDDYLKRLIDKQIL
jgi:TFIIF-interacting CTD phosphatase-like protein